MLVCVSERKWQVRECVRSGGKGGLGLKVIKFKGFKKNSYGSDHLLAVSLIRMREKCESKRNRQRK